MLPFNSSVWIAQYPSLILNGSTQTNWTAEELTEIWYNEVLVLGSKLFSMLCENTPLNPTSGTINAWDATTNIPELNNSVPAIGVSYLCIIAGTINFGSGEILFNVYDIVAFNSLLMQWLNVGQPVIYYWAGILLAHLISLYNRPAVGRLSNATEGDVSGAFSYQDTLSNEWWNQTTYGARIWKLLSQRGGFTAFINQPYGGILYQGNNNVYGN